MNVDELTAEVLALSTGDRALLVDRLVESLDPIGDASIRDLWAAEAIRRRDEIRTGTVQAIPGEQVFVEVRASLAARRAE